MSGIRTFYTSAIKKVEEWQASHTEEEATPAIIAGNLKFTSAKVGQIIRQGILPQLVTIVTEEYEKIGWNPRISRAIGSSPPNFLQVRECYQNIIDRVTEARAELDSSPSDDEQPLSVPEEEHYLVADEEISDVTLAGQKLWSLDINRLRPAPDRYELDKNPDAYHYLLNLQSAKSFHDHRDHASNSFFEYVNPNVFEYPTYKHFISLLDNYEPFAGDNETHSRVEIREMDDFLNACVRQPVMKYTFNWLVKKGILRNNATTKDFKKLLHGLWFNLYSRSRGVQDSSGFEHVFVGEIKNEKVVGLHNWIQIYHEEKKGSFDYKGFIKPRGSRGGRRGIDSYGIEMVQNISFEWLGYSKDSSTIFVGTSPEFELALYTISFYYEGNKDIFNLGPYKVEITAYDYMDYKTKTKCIGTSFPALLPMTQEEGAIKIQAAYRGKHVRNNHHQGKYNKK